MGEIAFAKVPHRAPGGREGMNKKDEDAFREALRAAEWRAEDALHRIRDAQRILDESKNKKLDVIDHRSREGVG